jgi:MFS family permease
MSLSTADAPAATSESDSARTLAIINRIEALPVTALHIRARLGVGTATFFDGFDVLTIGSALPVLVTQWSLTPREVGYIISAGFVGQLLGSLIFPILAERFGRLRATTWSVAIFGLTSLLCAFAGTYTALIVFRVIQGIGLGGELPVAAAYINEIAKAEGRGRFVIFYEIIFPFGLFASTLLGLWIVPNFGWQVMFVIAGLPAALALLLRFMLPESPRWLATKGRFTEAEDAVGRFERSAKAGHETAARPRVLTLAAVEGRTRWGEIFEARYLRRTLVAWTIWFAGGFLSNALTTWFPTIYRTMFHLSVSDALKYGVATTVGGVVGSAVCALMIDRIGRRPWMTIAFAGCAICFFSILAVGTLTAEIVMVFVAVSFGLVSAAFITAYAYTPEIYPTRMRAYGCGVASAVLRLAGAIAPTLIGVLVADYSLNSVFIALGIVALAASVIVGLFAVETKGRILEDISA